MYFPFTLKSPGKQNPPGSPIRAPVIREARLQCFCTSLKNLIFQVQNSVVTQPLKKKISHYLQF